MNSHQTTDNLLQWLRDYADNRINSRLIDERRTIPPYVVLDFGNRGLLGMQVPTEYGGLGLNNTDTMRIIEQIGAIDQALALFVGLNNILGIRPILNHAPQPLRDELLPILATGRELGAFAITEPGAGSNPQAIRSSALINGPNQWLLNGKKIWSGSAAWAGVINIVVQQIDANGHVSGANAFAVRQGTPGLRQGPEALTMGMRGMVQNAFTMTDVAMDASHLLGSAGGGMDVAQDTLTYGRLAIGATSVGGMKRCAQLMLRYAESRTVSTGRLLDNPVTLVRLSELLAAIDTMSALMRRMTTLLDQGQTVATDVYTACKIAGPELFWQAADQLVQLMGGRGYIETNIAPQLLRDARILRIFEGPTETLTLFLGSRVVNQPQLLDTFLRESCAAPDVADRFKAISVQIQQARGLLPFQDGLDQTRWAYHLLGELATWAVLWAAAKHGQCDATTLAWVTGRFEQKVAAANLGGVIGNALLSAQSLAARINTYTDAIGNVEQSLAGEDRDLDQLLRRADAPPQSVAAPTTTFTPLPDWAPPVFDAPVEASGSPHFDPAMLTPVATNGSNDHSALRNWIINWMSNALNVPAMAIETDRPFAEYGMDSVQAVEFAHDLEVHLDYQVELNETLAWNFPTIDALVDYLGSVLSPDAPADLSTNSNGIFDDSSLDAMSDDELAQLLANELL